MLPSRPLRLGKRSRWDGPDTDVEPQKSSCHRGQLSLNFNRRARSEKSQRVKRSRVSIGHSMRKSAACLIRFTGSGVSRSDAILHRYRYRSGNSGCVLQLLFIGWTAKHRREPFSSSRVGRYAHCHVLEGLAIRTPSCLSQIQGRILSSSPTTRRRSRVDGGPTQGVAGGD